MRALLIIILVAVLFSSCDTSNKDWQKQKEEQLKEALETAENTTIKADTIFLGLQFGMTKIEATTHLDDLVQQNKLYIADGGYYTYDFNARTAVIKSRIGLDYYNDRLYKVVISLQSMGSIMDSRILSFEANEVFKVKAINERYNSYTAKNLLGDYEFYYIKDNVIVEVSSGAYARLSYTNAPILKLIKAQKDNKTMNTISDL